MRGNQAVALDRGSHLGPYEILGLIGSGGMGEVYRARDTRLGRDVAVKVLPAEFADHPERVRRFEQEARAVAALNHPNILSIYDVGEHEGSPYLVTELLGGESLREMLLDGPLPIRMVIDIGTQVAEGLAAAHEKGIVHRDLKPGNVFVTKERRGKILDFGLARLTKGDGDSAPDSRAPTADQGTKPGTVMGTVGYMSPEQVKGLRVDGRADIFALGVMLYEMLSGERPFKGDSEAEVMTAILKEEPPQLSSGELAIPPMIERTMAHCLEKDPDRRFQSAQDIAFALESVTSASGMSVTIPPLPEEKRRRAFRWAVAVTACLVLASGVVSMGLLWGRHEYRKPVPIYQRITFRRGAARAAMFTPDLQSVVYSASWEGGEQDALYVQRLASPDARPLGVSGTVVGVAGADAFYLHKGTLSQIPLEGGTPRDLLAGIANADCDRTGTRLAIVRRDYGRNVRNYFCRLEYPVGRVLLESKGQQFILDPRISPDGKRIAFIWVGNLSSGLGDICVLDESGRKRTLARDRQNLGHLREATHCLAWSADGDEVWFMTGETENSVEIHAVSLAGKERLVARLPGRLRLRDIASDGRVLVTLGRARFELRGRLAGDEMERDYSWLDGTCLPTLSPDGTQFVFQELGEGGGIYATAYHWRVGDPAPIRLCPGYPMDVSPDWKKVLISVPGRNYRVMPLGAGQAVEVPAGPLKDLGWARWHPDGNRIVFYAFDADGVRGIFAQDLSDGSQRHIGDGALPETFSADGRYVVAWSRDVDGCVYYPMDGGEPKPIPFLAKRDVPRAFSHDGRWLFVGKRRGVCMYVVDRIDLKNGSRKPWLAVTPPDRAGVYATQGIDGLWITPSGRYYLYGYGRVLQDLYLAEGLK